jgi:hypothetical protein
MGWELGLPSPSWSLFWCSGEGALRTRHQTGFTRCLSLRRQRGLSTLLIDERCLMKTATDRAAEAVEAAEIMFADEMGATLGLSPAAKVALIVKIAAALEAAVAEERQRLTWVL